MLYADENFPRPTVVELRRLGHDVLTVQEVGQANIGVDDSTVLAQATRLGRIVLTQNRKDFRQLHGTGVPHAGIVICTLDSDFAGLAARIDAALAGVGDPGGILLSVVRPRI